MVKKAKKRTRPGPTKAQPKAKAKTRSKARPRAAPSKKKARKAPPKGAAKTRAAKKPVAKKAIAKKAPPQRARSATKAKGSGTTASVILVGASTAKPREPKIPKKWLKHYRRLAQLRNTLLEQSGRLAQEVHQEAIGFSMHMADSGTDSFDRDFALSLLSADQNALAQIDAAIERIRNGQYGICEMTGKPIGMARLEAIPWTRFSYEAQQQLERSSGFGGRIHLGSLRTVHGDDSADVPEPEEPEEPKE